MILICPTAFKGTLSASEATVAMAAGARRAAPGVTLRQQPLSDGGNGLLDALESAAGGTIRRARVAGPLGTSVTAHYLVQDQQVVVETAEACGLHRVAPSHLDPLGASTRGVGELILAAAASVGDGGRLVVGLGGSATVDAGSGMVTTLGWRLLDDQGEPIPSGGAGLAALVGIERTTPPPHPPLPPLVVLADVRNPLLGQRGAAPVFAPQKGADAAAVERLERGLERWASVVDQALGREVAELPGAGAAGGLGAAFAAFLDAAPRAGAEWVLEEAGFDAALEGAVAVVTGEGSWDAQSSMGKATGEVIRRSRRAGVPVLFVTGRAEAAAPEGVTMITGNGAVLDADGLTLRVAESLPGLLPGPGGP